MYRLNSGLRLLAATSAVALATSFLTSCAASTQTVDCAEINPTINSTPMTSPLWQSGETETYGFGAYQCDVAVSVKVTPVPLEVSGDGNLAPYTTGETYVVVGNGQTVLAAIDTKSDMSTSVGGASKVVASSSGVADVKKGETFQIFMDVKATEWAEFYGAERFKVKVELLDAAGKLLDSFTSTRDFGYGAPIKETY